MFFVGIDWADDHHDISFVNEKGQELKRFRISNDPDGFLNLLSEVQNLDGNPQNVVFGLEKPHGLLVDFLLDHGYTVYPVNPKSAERFRDRHSTSNKKDDGLDAFVLADALRTDLHRFIPLKPDSEIARELKGLVMDREVLIRSKTRTVNQITSCLKEYFPAVLEIFSNLQSDTALDFLMAYPTPEVLAHISFEEFKRFLNERHYPWKMLGKTPEEFYQKVNSLKLLKPDAVVARTKSRFMLVLLEQLRTLLHQVREYDRIIDELMKRHPDGDIFTSLPGAGEKLAPKLAAHFGEDRSRFNNFESVQRLAGTAPVTQRSGQWEHIHRRHACQGSFRDVLIQFAFVTLNRCLWARKYYDEKRKAGNSHAAALRALANKWVKIIFTIWRKRNLYQETIFLASRQQHALLNAS